MAILRKKFKILLASSQGEGTGADDENIVLSRNVKELQAEVDLMKMQIIEKDDRIAKLTG